MAGHQSMPRAERVFYRKEENWQRIWPSTEIPPSMGCHDPQHESANWLGGLDLNLDETTWPNSSYADIQGRLQGKKTNKGGQHVLLLDSNRWYIYAWTPHHKFFEVVRPFTATGPADVKPLVDMITPLVVGATKDPTDKRKQLFSECVHITMDNLFSCDEV